MLEQEGIINKEINEWIATRNMKTIHKTIKSRLNEIKMSFLRRMDNTNKTNLDQTIKNERNRKWNNRLGAAIRFSMFRMTYNWVAKSMGRNKTTKNREHMYNSYW